MAKNDLVAKIGADAGEFAKTMADAKANLKDIMKTMKDTTDQFKGLGGVSSETARKLEAVTQEFERLGQMDIGAGEGLAELEKTMKELQEISTEGFSKEMADNINKVSESSKGLNEVISAAKTRYDDLGKSTQSIKREYMALEKRVISMTREWENMTEEERTSSAGVNYRKKMQELREEAARLKDTMGDVKAEIRELASDHSNLDAFNEVLGVSTNALSTLSSTYAMVTGDEKSFKDAVVAFTAAQSLANTATKLANLLNKSNIAIIKVQKIQTWALNKALAGRTAAEYAQAVATGKATVAQRAFNAVAKANPYILLVSAVVALTAALGGLYLAFTKNTKASKEETEADKELKKTLFGIQVEGREAALKIDMLAQAWKKSNSNLKDKEKYLKTYKSELKKVGIEVKNVGELEKAMSSESLKALKDSIAKKTAMRLAEAKQRYAIEKLAQLQLSRAALEERVRNTSGTAHDVMVKALQTSIHKEKELKGAISQSNDEIAKLATENAQLTEVYDEQAKSKEKATPKAQDYKGATALIDKQIAELKKQLEATGKPIEYYGNIQLRIENLEAQKKRIEAEIGEVKIAARLGANLGTFNVDGAPIMDSIEKNIKPIKIKTEFGDYEASVKETTDYTIQTWSKALSTDVTKKFFNTQREEMENYKQVAQETAGALSSTFQTIGGMIGGETGDMVTDIGSLIAAIGALIPALMGKSVAQSVDQSSKAPWPVQAFVIAANVAAVMAAFQKISKHAQGGIINGKTSVGDHNLILANKGEMVLNNGQQARLWRMLSQPYSADTLTAGKVEFEIKGQQLVGVLKNINTKTSKIR